MRSQNRAEEQIRLNRIERDFRASAAQPRERRLRRLDAFEAKFYPCDVCGVETVTMPERRERVAGRSTWITPEGKFVLCMVHAAAARRQVGVSRYPPRKVRRR